LSVPRASQVHIRRGSWWHCLDDEDFDDRSEQKRRRPQVITADQRIENLMQELFRLHDLKKDGVLGEQELIKLNEKICMLHHGKDIDKTSVKQKYKELFRSKLNVDGDPVPYHVFRNYMIEVLDSLESTQRGQEMILEQFIAEACSGRAAFHFPSLASVSDAPFLSTISEPCQAGYRDA